MDASLKALDVDYVDLYQVHSWRGADYPIEATMEAMSQLQQQGKTRYIGVSNFNATQMDAAYSVAPFHSSQPQYNMIDRGIESHDLPYCEQRGIGNLAHSPLAKGLLTGKYRADHVFATDDERSGFPRFQGEAFATYVSVAQKLGEIADQRACTLVQLAIAWCLRQPAVTCVLAGAKSPAQVADYLPAADIDLTAEEIHRIDQILGNAAAS
jgi:aryl-alcohol dehydrogenase-like predicted oxidoreductase